MSTMLTPMPLCVIRLGGTDLLKLATIDRIIADSLESAGYQTRLRFAASKTTNTTVSSSAREYEMVINVFTPLGEQQNTSSLRKKNCGNGKSLAGKV